MWQNIKTGNVKYLAFKAKNKIGDDAPAVDSNVTVVSNTEFKVEESIGVFDVNNDVSGERNAYLVKADFDKGKSILSLS